MDKNNNKPETKPKKNKISVVKNVNEESKTKDVSKNNRKKSETKQLNNKANVVKNEKEEINNTGIVYSKDGEVKKDNNKLETNQQNNETPDVQNKKEEDELNEDDKDFKKELAIEASMQQVHKQILSTFHKVNPAEILYLDNEHSQNWMKVNAGVNVCLDLMRKLFDKGIEDFHEKFLKLDIDIREDDRKQVEKYQEGTAYTAKDDKTYPNIRKCIDFFAEEFLRADRAELAKQIFRKTAPFQWWDEERGKFNLAGAGCKRNEEKCDEEYFSLAEHFFANWKKRSCFKGKNGDENGDEILRKFRAVRKYGDVSGREKCDDEKFQEYFKQMEELLKNLVGLDDAGIKKGAEEGLKKLNFIKGNKDVISFKFQLEVLAQMRKEAKEIGKLASSIGGELTDADRRANAKSARSCQNALYDLEFEIMEKFVIGKLPGDINVQVNENLFDIIKTRRDAKEAFFQLNPFLHPKK